jgi:hypothetical protein
MFGILSEAAIMSGQHRRSENLRQAAEERQAGQGQAREHQQIRRSSAASLVVAGALLSSAMRRPTAPKHWPWLTALPAPQPTKIAAFAAERTAHSDLIWIKAHVREAGHRNIGYVCDGGDSRDRFFGHAVGSKYSALRAVSILASARCSASGSETKP